MNWQSLLDGAALRLRRRGHGRRRIILLVVLLLIGLLLGGYRLVTSDRQIERQAEEFLSNFFQTPVHIDSASFSFFDGIRVEGLRVEMEGEDSPIFAARSLRLSHDPLALLGGRLEVREIVAVNPTINLFSRDDEWNFQRLMPESTSQEGRPQRPVVYVEDGVVNVRQYQAEELIYQHSLQMSGVLQPASGRENVFTFFAGQIESGTVRGSISRGIVNMAEGTFNFEARASNIELTAELAETLPPEARQVWNRFMPSGNVSLKVVFRDDRSHQLGFGFWVEADLNGVALDYEHGGRRYHLEELTGQCAVSRDLLVLHDVHGVLVNLPEAPLAEAGDALSSDAAAQSSADVWNAPAGGREAASIPVELSGVVRGLDSERVGYDLEITAGDLDLLRMREFAVGLSPVMTSLYEDFQPAGRADVHLWMKRGASPDSETELRGNIALRSGRSHTRWFPYPIEEVFGDITLEPGVIVVNLTGRNGEARVAASGEVRPTSAGTGVDLTISAKRLRLDDKLREALAGSYPSYTDFYDSLRPGGSVDLEVKVECPPGGKSLVVNTIRLHDASLTYSQFPYRIRQARGTAVIRDGVCTMDVVGRHGDALVSVEGTFAVGGVDGSMIDLMVVGHNVSLDDDLAAALPADQRRVYQRYHPEGLADIVFRAQRSADTRGELIYHTRIGLRGGRVLFDDFPYPIEGVSGEMEISPGLFVLHNLRGTNSDAAISANGRIEHRGDDYSMDLLLRGQQVQLDRDLLGALAQHWPALWNDLELSGKVNVAVRLLKKPGADEPLETEVAMASDSLSLLYRPLPYRLENCEADVHFDGRRLTISNLTSRRGETSLSASGTISIVSPDDVEAVATGAAAANDAAGNSAGSRETVKAELAISATALELDEALLDALPEAIGGPLRQIDARGRIDLKVPELVYSRRHDGSTDIDWNCTAVVGQGSAELGMKLDRVVAYVEQQGSYRNGQLELGAELTMPHGRLAGNEVERLRAWFRKSASREAIEVVRLEGDIYGGKLEGSGFVSSDGSGAYALNVDFRGIDLETFVRRGMQMDATIEGGRLSGEVALRGGGDDGEDFLARGALRIRQTKMYRLPVIIQLLSALRLKSGANFESADADFSLRDGRYTFSRIVLEGPGLSLHGAGQMGGDGALGMYFTTGSGTSRNIIPALSDLAAGLKHELLLVEVSGSVNKPEVQGRMLTHLTAPLRELMALIKESQAER